MIIKSVIFLVLSYILFMIFSSIITKVINKIDNNRISSRHRDDTKLDNDDFLAVDISNEDDDIEDILYDYQIASENNEVILDYKGNIYYKDTTKHTINNSTIYVANQEGRIFTIYNHKFKLNNESTIDYNFKNNEDFDYIWNRSVINQKCNKKNEANNTKINDIKNNENKSKNSNTSKKYYRNNNKSYNIYEEYYVNNNQNSNISKDDDITQINNFSKNNYNTNTKTKKSNQEINNNYECQGNITSKFMDYYNLDNKPITYEYDALRELERSLNKDSAFNYNSKNDLYYRDYYLYNNDNINDYNYSNNSNYQESYNNYINNNYFYDNNDDYDCKDYYCDDPYCNNFSCNEYYNDYYTNSTNDDYCHNDDCNNDDCHNDEDYDKDDNYLF